MLIRAELLTPQLNLLSRPLYNGLFTLHGTIMIFLWVIPVQVGLANYLVPLMIGANDMAFPNLNFFPMFPLGLQGMVRRSASYAPEYADWNVLSSIGSFLLGVSILPFLANIIVSWIDGEPASHNPWHATGLEWSISSPPPPENFDEIPEVTLPPYNYGDPQYSVRDPSNPH